MKKKSKIKMRRATRYFYLTIASILFVISFVTLFGSFFGGTTSKTKEEIYKYTNNFQYDYTVNLKPNQYIDKQTLGMNENAYVTSLIDNINLNLNYDYISNEKSTIKYTYNIKGILNGVYTKDGEEQKIWTKEYILKEPTEATTIDEKFEINENIVLDLEEQNNLVKNFEQEMELSIDAKYNIIMEIKSDTTIEDEKIPNATISTISIDLGKKTTTITGENNKNDTQYISKEIETQTGTSTVKTVLGLIGLIISLLIYRYIFVKTTIMNKTRNEFRMELNRILRLCQDKIVQVSSKMEVDTTNVIDVKDFGEILKVSEELFKPILYWISPRNDEAWFTVMSHGVTYRYILRKD